MRISTQTGIASLNSVTKNYGLHCALSSVDLSLEGGKILALLGPNGAGKTTAVKLLLGLLKPSNGRVNVFGADPQRPENARTHRRHAAIGQRT